MCVCVDRRKEGGPGRCGRGDARRARRAEGAVGGWVKTQRPRFGPLANRSAPEATTSSSAGSELRDAIILYKIQYTRIYSIYEYNYTQGVTCRTCCIGKTRSLRLRKGVPRYCNPASRTIDEAAPLPSADARERHVTRCRGTSV